MISIHYLKMLKHLKEITFHFHYRTDYIPHPVQKHEPRAGEVYQPPKTAMEGLSMYTQDFPGHKAAPTQLIKRKDARSVPNVKFEASPTYASE